MQGNNMVPGSNQGGNKPSGLSWSSPPAGSTSPLLGSSSKPLVQPASAPKQVVHSTPAVSKPKVVRESGTGRMVGSFVGGVVVGGLLMWGWTTSNPAAPISTAPTTNTGSVAVGSNTNTVGGVIGTTGSAPSPAIGSTHTLTVAAQPSGMKVVVASATVSAPTWMVVYELYQGKPFRALGAKMFFPEYNGTGGTISLLRETKPNTSYFVGQAVDDGDHVFEIHVDKDIVDSNGIMSGVTFKAE